MTCWCNIGVCIWRIMRWRGFLFFVVAIDFNANDDAFVIHVANPFELL